MDEVIGMNHEEREGLPNLITEEEEIEEERYLVTYTDLCVLFVAFFGILYLMSVQ